MKNLKSQLPDKYFYGLLFLCWGVPAAYVSYLYWGAVADSINGYFGMLMTYFIGYCLLIVVVLYLCTNVMMLLIGLIMCLRK